MSVFAHPHVFISASIDCEFAGDILKNIHVVWSFDSFYSATMLLDADTDKNRVISKEENTFVHDNLFVNLRNYKYFLQAVDKNGKDISIIDPETEELNFKAVFNKKNDELEYHFTLPLNINVSENLSIFFYDPEYFVAYQTTEPLAPLYAASIPQNIKISTQTKEVQNQDWGAYTQDVLQITKEM